MRFSKWHGLGNDYLLVQRAEIGTPLTEEQVRRLCDYHFGVGSDGVRGRLGRRGRSGGSDLEPRRLDGRTVGERNTHRRPLARAPERCRHRAHPWARARWSGGCEAGRTSKWTWVPWTSRTPRHSTWGETLEFTPASAETRTRSSAVSPSARTCSGSARSSRTTSGSPSARTCSSSAWTGRATSRSASGSAERGDPLVRHERGGDRRRRGRARLVREPGDRSPRRRRPPRRARRLPWRLASPARSTGDLHRRGERGARPVRFAKRLGGSAVPR